MKNMRMQLAKREIEIGIEGLCEECGNYSILEELEGLLLCPECFEALS